MKTIKNIIINYIKTLSFKSFLTWLVQFVKRNFFQLLILFVSIFVYDAFSLKNLANLLLNCFKPSNCESISGDANPDTNPGESSSTDKSEKNTGWNQYTGAFLFGTSIVLCMYFQGHLPFVINNLIILFNPSLAPKTQTQLELLRDAIRAIRGENNIITRASLKRIPDVILDIGIISNTFSTDPERVEQIANCLLRSYSAFVVFAALDYLEEGASPQFVEFLNAIRTVYVQKYNEAKATTGRRY